MAYITALQWQAAAVSAFERTAKELLGITRKKDFVLTVSSRPGVVAAVNWDFARDAAGKIESASVRLYLPVLKPGVKLTRRDADALAGLWIHELMHVLYTDRDAWRRGCANGKMFAALVNGLEDVRGEGEMLSRNAVPGAPRCLVEAVNRMVWNGPVTPESVNDRKSLPALLAYLGRHDVLGYDLTRVPEMWAALTPANRATVRALLDGLKACQNTGDVVTLLERFFAGDLEDDQQDGDQQDGDQQDGDQQDGDQQDGDQQDGEGEGEGDKKAADVFKGASPNESAESAEMSEGAESLARDLNGGDLDPADHSLIGVHMQTPKISTSRRWFYGSEACLDDVPGVANLRATIRRLVVSPERYGWQAHLERGRLDPRALPRAQMGQRDVYRRVDETEGYAAAVSMVLDMSGSMGHDVVAQAAMAYQVALAVEAAGAKIEVRAFTSQKRLEVVKAFHEKASASRDAFRAAMSAPGSNTPLAPSIVVAARDLAAVDATDRILIVMTDGGDDYGAGRVRRALRLVRQMDVRTVGVVIGSQAPYEFGFDAADAAVNSPASELGASVMGELVKQFERGRAAA